MAKIIGNALPNIPWQDKLRAGDSFRFGVMTTTRSFRVISSPLPAASSTPQLSRLRAMRPPRRFPAATTAHADIFVAFSDDGINWKINHEPIEFQTGSAATRR